MKNSRLCLFAFLSTVLCWGQSLRQVQQDYLDSLVKSEMEQWKVAGASISVVRGDSTIFDRGYGFKDAEGVDSVTADTRFVMGSSAKAFSGALVAQLDTDSVVNINAPLSENLEISFNDSDLDKTVTLKDMLTHRTGIPGHDFVWLTQNIDRTELKEKLKFLPVSAALREKFQYNNIVYSIAAYASAQIDGRSWDESMSEVLFKPLEMEDSGILDINETSSPEYSLSFIHNGTFFSPLPFRDLNAVAPAGGVYTTSSDLANWVTMLLNDGNFKGEKVLDTVSIKKMFHPHTISIFPRKFNEQFYENYGLGWMITSYRGHLHIHHTGNIDGFTSTVDLWPDDGIGISILSNTAYANNFTEVLKFKVLDYLLQMTPIDWSQRYREMIANFEAKKQRKSSKSNEVQIAETPNLQDFEGHFRNKAYGELKIKTEEKLLSGKFGEIPLILHPKGRDQFSERTVLNGQEFIFVRDPNGEVIGVKTTFPSSIVPILFKKITT